MVPVQISQTYEANSAYSAFILPRFARGGESFSVMKGQRMQQRLEEINKVIKTQNYYEWRASQQPEKDLKTFLAPDPLW
jgi:hypothetical protein